MSENPYAAPVAPAASSLPDEYGTNGYRAASQGKRLVNFIIDFVAVRILSFAAGFTFGILFVVINGGEFTRDQEFMLNLAGFGISIATLLAYFVLLEGVGKVTIGKLLTGTRVVSANGGTASFGQIVGRSFARMIPFEPLSFLIGDKTSGWHDSLSGTRVIDVRAGRVPHRID